MPQVSSIRLLLSSTNHPTSLLKPSSLSTLSLLFRPKTPKPQNRPLSFTVFSSYSKKSCGYSNFSRGNCSWSRESEKRDKGSAMEVTESVKYNKKRTEGRDKSGKPKKQLHLKVRKLNPVNTICYFQILGTGMDTHDTSPSVLLFFDKQRFIFNAGEGLQRFCTEHKIKLSKIDHIFFSRVCSETAGGLPGLLLTLAGMGDEGIAVNVWGPSDLKYLVDAMGSFIPKAAIVNTHSFGPPPGSNIKEFDDPIVLIDDEVVKILAFLLKPKLGFDETMEAKVSDPKSEIALKPGDISVIYACELPEIQGKFDPKKAAALGLKTGPKYRELQVGNSVKSDHQNIMVHPSDVLGPSIPGPVVLLVDCPTPSHLQELSSLQSLNTYYVNTPETRCKTVNCVIHLSPAAVVNTTDYQIWMSRFGGAQHIMAGHEMRNIEVPILKASARIAARLNYLCPQIFPAPGFWSLPNLKLLEPCSGSKKEALVSKHCQSISAENLLKFHCRPHAQLGLDQSSIPNTVTSSEVINELLLELPEILETSKQVTKLWNEGDSRNIQTSTSTEQGNRMIEEPWLNENEESWLNEKEIPDCLEDVTREDMEIVFLGTGSSQPSKYRNVSSILINLFSKGTLLLDCGEGTLGQLKRRFGVEGADDAIRALKCIWISHIHADHHTGLARILAQRRDLLKGIPHEPIVVVGPRKLKVFLDAYQKLEDLDMQFLDCRHTTESSLEIFEKSNQEQLPPEEEIENREQKIDSTYTLFGRGSRMESYWKRQNSASLDVKMTFPVLRCLKNALREAGLDGLESVPVVHCPQAFGVVLKGEGRVNRVGKFVPGWKVVYSGDTRPCPELVKASRGATVLIHEATFEDGMLDEAIARNHSTTKEAVEVGDSAGAYRIILTHFSQRYPKIPVLDDENRMHKSCIAFDLMSVNLADLHVLPKVVPYLKLLFRDEMIFEESEEVEDVASAAE